MRSAQELLNTVITHLRQQGEKSVVSVGSAYSGRLRAPNGFKDAVGCLLPDTEYRSGMEGSDIKDLLQSKLLTSERNEEFSKHEKLLSYLQKIHDDGVSMQDWERQWYMLADDMHLRYNKP